MTLRGWKVRRHNARQILLLELAKSAGLEAVMEVGKLGTRKRSRGIKVGRDQRVGEGAGSVTETAFDVTVTFTVQRQTNAIVR